MKNTLFFKVLILLLIISAYSCADKPTKTVNKTKIENREAENKMISLLDKGFYKALFVPNSDKLIVSSENDKGLSVYDFKNDVVEHLTSKEGAGMYPKMTSDGKYVIYQTHEFKNRRRLTSIFLQDIVEKTTIPVVTGKRDIKLLDVKNSKIFFLDGNNVNSFDIASGETTINPKDALLAFSDNNLNLSILANGKKTDINPQGEGNYIWVSLSPDKRKILYNYPKKGAFISDLNGKTKFELGKLDAAKWSIDGQWIVGMEDYDDGHKYTKSDILMISSDGKSKKNLTENSDLITLFPNISADNKKVIYNTEEGRVYLMKIK